MKRVVGSVLVLVLVVLAAWGGLSYWFGLQTEREYRNFMQQASDWKDFKLTSTEYRRGIFTSQATATLELIQAPSPPNQDLQREQEKTPFRLLLAHQITHGPVPLGRLPQAGSILHPALAVVETKMSLDPQMKELLKDIKLPEGAPPSMDVSTILHWGGKGDTHVLVHSFQGELGDDPKVAIDFAGLKGQFQFTPGFKQVDGTFSTERFSGSIARKSVLQMKGMRCSFHQTEGTHGIYLGDVAYDVDLVELKNQDAARADADFSIQGIKVKAVAQESDHDLSSSGTISVDRLVLKEGAFKSAVFELELRKLDARVLSEFQDTVQKLQRDSAGTEALPDQTLAALLTILPKLLKSSPEVEIKQLGFESEDGDVRANALLKVDGRKIQGSLNLPALLDAAELDLAVSAAEGTLVRLLKSFEQRSESGADGGTGEDRSARTKRDKEIEAEIRAQLGALAAQNLLVLEKGVYRMSARYAKGQVTLNGRPIRLDQLLGQ
jgi:uncharacterized protein YdgA (DUF945 family)